jgi:(S)-mandelate dehydrogenase
MVDGGFRRGTDIAKAVALGARSVALGRSVLYGLAAGGESGVMRALDIFKAELDRTLALLGCPSVSDLSPSFLFGACDEPVGDIPMLPTGSRRK